MVGCSWTLSPIACHTAASSERPTLRFSRRLEEYGLPYRETPASSDGAVDPGLVIPHPNNRLQHLDGGACRSGVEVHHRAALVTISDGYGSGLVGFSEREDTSHPFVFFEED